MTRRGEAALTRNAMKREHKNITILNKRASHDYEFIQKYITGIVLTGTEIKSLRNGKASLVDAFCLLINGEVFAKNIHIAEYEFGSYNNHDPKRDRKLLLNRVEINKLEMKLKDKGLTVVVTKMFLNEKGWAKMEIALARGKKQFDKREDIKTRDANREMDRAKKNF